MTYEIVIPVIVSFAISALLGPIVIPFLRRLKVGQTERKELESHLKKNGTPTMGGLMILASIIITSVFYVKDYPKIVPILFMTVGFGVIGFLDDYLKVVLRRSDGLLAWQKMLCQIVVTTVFAVYMGCYSDVPLTMLIPFSGGKYLDLGWGAFPVLYLAVIGTVNGTNFTDGLDGLASSVTIMVMENMRPSPRIVWEMSSMLAPQSASVVAMAATTPERSLPRTEMTHFMGNLLSSGDGILQLACARLGWRG